LRDSCRAGVSLKEGDWKQRILSAKVHTNEIIKHMKNVIKLTCLALGTAFLTTAVPAAFSGTESTGCCSAVVPMADTGKADTKAKAYPLDTCVVSGEKLGGEMGEPYVFTHDGQEVKLCCKSCKKKFDKSPDTYMKKIKEAKK